MEPNDAIQEQVRLAQLVKACIDVLKIPTILLPMDAEELTTQLEQQAGPFLRKADPSLPTIKWLFHKDRLPWSASEQRFTQVCTNFVALKKCLGAIIDSVAAFEAARTGKLPMVQRWITDYAQYKDMSGPSGQTLLYTAIKAGQLALVENLVLECNCDVNAPNAEDGLLPLHAALALNNARHPSASAILRLLRNRADMLKLTQSDRHSFDAAIEMGDSLSDSQQRGVVPWEAQDASFAWHRVNWLEAEQLDVAYREDRPMFNYSRNNSNYSVDMRSFTRIETTPTGAPVVSYLRRKLAPSADRAVWWQWQDSEGKWHAFPEAVQSQISKWFSIGIGERRPLKINLRDPTGQEYNVIFDADNFCLHEQTRGSQSSWVPPVRWCPAPAAGAKSELDNLMDSYLDSLESGDDNEEEDGTIFESSDLFPTERIPKESAAPEEVLSQLSLQGNSPDAESVVVRFYRSAAAQEPFLKNLTLLGKPITVVLSGSFDLEVTATPAQHDIIAQLLQLGDRMIHHIEERVRIDAQAIRREAEAQLQQEAPAIKVEPGESAVVATKALEVFVLYNLGKLMEHLKTADASADTQLSIRREGQHMVFHLVGTALQHTALQGITSRVVELRVLCNIALREFHRKATRQLQSIQVHLSYVPYQKSNKDAWVSFLKRFSEALKTEMSRLQTEFAAHLDDIIAQTLEAACLDTGNWRAVTLSLPQLAADTIMTEPEVSGLLELTFVKILEAAKLDVTDYLNKLDGSTSSSVQTAIAQLELHFQKIAAELSGSLARPQTVLVDRARPLPSLLRRIYIFSCCCKMRTPLFARSRELLDLINGNQVVALATGTGSGKSTNMPALLVAEGYKRVLVTQPRRLPCQMLYERLESIFGDHLVGWEVSGESVNVWNPICYLTDGLIKERLVINPKLVEADVIVLDEIHERGVNMDICIAALAQLVNARQLKAKIVLSSATLDPSVKTPFSSTGVRDFSLEVLAPFPVRVHSMPGHNAVATVVELFGQRDRSDQILCFVPTVGEVRQSCAMFRKLTGSLAFPLYAQQSPADQKRFLEKGSVFFSTNIAETSLTFPCLRYVVDAGQVNVPSIDAGNRSLTLKVTAAPKATLKQRRGRLGRTMLGEYYQLYDEREISEEYAPPQITTTDLTDVEFGLIRANCLEGIGKFALTMPSKPPAAALLAARELLFELGIIHNPNTLGAVELTPLGHDLIKMPSVGGARLSRAVYEGLVFRRCGRDMLRLVATMNAMGGSPEAILQVIPVSCKSSEGDFLSIIKVMDLVCNAYGVHVLRHDNKSFSIEHLCRSVGIQSGFHLIRRALRSYKKLENDFNNCMQLEYSSQCHFSSAGAWQPIARSLLAGFGDYAFVSCARLFGQKHHFDKVVLASKGRTSSKPAVATISSGSSLYRRFAQDPVPYAFSDAIVYSPSQPTLGLLSLCGTFEPQWLEEWMTMKFVEITDNDAPKCRSHTSLDLKTSVEGNRLKVWGRASRVLSYLEDLMSTLLVTESIVLELNDVQDKDKFEKNMKDAMQQVGVFHPLMWRWKNSKQVEVTMSSKARKVTATGREADVAEVKAEFRSWLGWLKYCHVYRKKDEGVMPRPLRSRDAAIEQRIASVTDPDRSAVSLWEATRGKKSDRVSRMGVVAWIAVTQFGARLEGGFVRDWIVGGLQAAPPAGTPAHELVIQSSNIFKVHPQYVPADLDLQLPVHQQFDITRFVTMLHRFGFEVRVSESVVREPWRYFLILDQHSPTGPFCLDLVEPHVVLCHDMVDFDVSNLYCESNYTRELGMRVDLTVQPWNHTLDDIVDRIQKKVFLCLAAQSETIKARIAKMESRGWKLLANPNVPFTPNRGPEFGATLVSLPRRDPQFQHVADMIHASLPQAFIKRVEVINNHNLTAVYVHMKDIIARENGGNPNERQLFHGTKAAGAVGIPEAGFDDRFYELGGAFGSGAYFADLAQKSNDYTAGPERTMFINSVILGKEHVLTDFGHHFARAPKGFHSVHYTGGRHEYIVYRYGQALPLFRVTYVLQ